MHWLRPLITALVLLAGFFAAITAQGQTAGTESTFGVAGFTRDQEPAAQPSAECANGLACTGDVRIQAEGGLGGDRLAFGPTTGLLLSGRYRWLQVGLSYQHSTDLEGGESHFPEEEYVDRYTNTLGGQLGIAQRALGLRWEGALTSGVRTLVYRELGAEPGAGLVSESDLVLGLRGAVGYEFAPTSTRHLLIGLALSAGSSVTRGRHTLKDADGWAPSGSALLTLGYVLDI